MGSTSLIGSGEITIPAACFEACLVSPSRRLAMSKSLPTCVLFSTSSFNFGSCSSASSSVILSVSGIRFVKALESSNGNPSARGYIFYDPFCHHRTKGNNLGDMVMPILIAHIINNRVPAFNTKVDIDIG